MAIRIKSALEQILRTALVCIQILNRSLCIAQTLAGIQEGLHSLSVCCWTVVLA